KLGNRTAAAPISGRTALRRVIPSRHSRLGLVVRLSGARVRGFLSPAQRLRNSRPSDIQPSALMAMAPVDEPACWFMVLRNELLDGEGELRSSESEPRGSGAPPGAPSPSPLALAY